MYMIKEEQFEWGDLHCYLDDYELDEEDEEDELLNISFSSWERESFEKLEDLGFLGSDEYNEKVYDYKTVGDDADIILKREDGSFHQLHCSLDASSPDITTELGRPEFVSWY